MTLHTDDRDLLTTGQVATLLGTTARHVVNLSSAGSCPTRWPARTGAFVAWTPSPWPGAPRRTRVGRSPMTSFARSGSTGLRRASSPETPWERWRKRGPRRSQLAGEPDGARWLREWLGLIDRGPEAVMRAMTSIDPLARELRQNSPFVGLLAPTVRDGPSWRRFAQRGVPPPGTVR